MFADSAPFSLERLVVTVAARLMAANAATAAQVSQDMLELLVDYFAVDVSFLRHNDHSIHASILIAEWPVRTDVPDPDPIGVVYFENADPVFKYAEHFKKPAVFRPDDADYQKRIEQGRNIPQTSLAAAPLVSGDVTTGVLGFVKIGDREWREDELNALEAIGSLFAQVQARVKAEEQLRYLADRDDLTGVYNRRALLAHLEKRLAAGRSGPVTALFFDLDRLKTINDYLGHTAGDRFLKVLAERLQERTKPKTVIARLGGDEFVVVPASRLTAVAAEKMGGELLDAISERVSLDGEVLARTVSVGVAQGVPGRDTTSDLLRRADLALLNAKAAGGNQVAMFTDEMSQEAEYRTDIELHLGSVIEDGALYLRYLPEVDMRTGEVLAAEALVRWDHPTRGAISPADFIPVAESINLAGELGRWVIRTACSEFASFRAAGIGIGTVLRINVSPVQLVSAGFAESVAATMREFGLEPGSICLEITESVVVQDIETTSITLNGLKAAGVQIAIDDFGTGYSVLSHLKALPVDVLKIDRSFVTDLGSNPDDLAIVRATIALAEAFGLQLVAEGVETEAAAITLLRHGCHRAQGFLLSPPISATDLAALLTKGHVSARFSAPAGE
ncbi:putative bifunctional diguanylate cyclase/phosphodiesterase [Mycolicibacterium arenosum]|uniref:EAL domain-containing protein n=1 Tax=Mycolicibacterium arenosum TaxID=2952157 RepID=A0ABT1M5U7_9MYCO|nr:EAL domain-containing protein [Mycolicibacterium sp. CAU 1645]MCP9274476.1 EAL domain-containing protein [Mycolicibacterium sp. CAU 1645]